ncbi:hypothetical protein CBM2623_B30208 [Cupriavidus taiwanensis]|nr:hypothetical protein CBM2623_B30208 [Cupriavidus taiwanensis]
MLITHAEGQCPRTWRRNCAPCLYVRLAVVAWVQFSKLSELNIPCMGLINAAVCFH